MAALLVAALQADTLYVSPEGPLRSLAAARDKIRELRRGGNKSPMTVLVRGGTYFLTETLVLTPEDSGVVYAAYPNERPIITGGRKIEGWKKGERQLWTAPAPFVFRQMFVAGHRAQRSRTPNKGYYRHDGRIPQAYPFLFRFRGNDIPKSWAERGDVELCALLAWQEVRMPISEVDEANHTAKLPGAAPLSTRNQSEILYWIENAPDGPDYPGEWYLGRKAGTVSYWPMPEEDLTRGDVIAPALVELVRLEGGQVGDLPHLVRDITFRGLDFRHADWQIGPQGYSDMQAAATVPAAFEATGAENISVENCMFTQSGGYAVSFGMGAHRNRVVANEITDMGAGGIKIGEALKDSQRENEAERNSGNQITDNEIHNLGLVFPGGVGKNVVRNNVFAFGKEYQMTRNRSEKHISFTFERNIVYFDQGGLLGHNWTGGLRMNHNLYWDARGFDVRPAGRSWTEWQKSGQDQESLIADPLFVNAGNFDFSLRPDSPARKIGFQPIDLRSVGPRVPAGPR